jgi:hypothetical protein
VSKNKNAATESAETISAIEARIREVVLKGEPQPPQLLSDALRLVEIVQSLDEENNQLAQRVLIAEGAVAKVRQMQNAKSSKKQAKIFRKIVRDDARDYAKDHVDEDAKKFYTNINNKMVKTRRRAVLAIMFLCGIIIVEGILLAATLFKWF